MLEMSALNPNDWPLKINHLGAVRFQAYNLPEIQWAAGRQRITYPDDSCHAGCRAKSAAADVFAAERVGKMSRKILFYRGYRRNPGESFSP